MKPTVRCVPPAGNSNISFVSRLEEVADTIDTLVAAEPARAVALYEAFLAGCHAKADELDDSSGGFGQFAQDDPAVAKDIAALNVVWSPKKDWPRLATAMNPGRSK